MFLYVLLIVGAGGQPVTGPYFYSEARCQQARDWLKESAPAGTVAQCHPLTDPYLDGTGMPPRPARKPMG